MRNKMFLILLIAFLFKISTSELIVETSSGPIRGVASLSDDVEAFLGIPYAEPPLGNLRFARPVPKKPWKTVYNATNLSPPCAQYSIGTHYFMPDLTNMSEDCLYLNVWIPKNDSNKDFRPIIIYIHPGAFTTGSSNLKVHDGSHFASRGDVIVVTINYRLGIFGYFLAYNEDAGGNMGMYDQLMAIKWVKANAKNLKGDPDNIVLMGASAGAWSVSAHMISPLSMDLFSKAILHSGSILHPFLLDDNARLFRNSEKAAFLLGCTDDNLNLRDNPQAVVDCLKGKTKEDLIAAEKSLFVTQTFTFFPRINDEFLPKSSISLIREGKFRKNIPVIAGINKDEGSLFLAVALPGYFEVYGNNELSVTKRFALAVIQGTAKERFGLSRVSDIGNYYLNTVKNRTTMEYTKIMADALGDFIIGCSSVFFSDFLSVKGNPVFFYKFAYKSPTSPTADWYGTAHLDELQYVFGHSYHGNLTAEEIELSHRLMDRWSAFAKTGSPNVPNHIPWFRYSYHNPLYLDIGQDEESLRLKPSNHCEIWRERFGASFDADLIRTLQNSEMNKFN